MLSAHVARFLHLGKRPIFAAVRIPAWARMRVPITASEFQCSGDHDAADKSPEAVVARMETALKDGRLGDVIREADGLPPKSKEAVSPFLEKVTARASVEQALASLESKLKTTMSGAPAVCSPSCSRRVHPPAGAQAPSPFSRIPFIATRATTR